MKRFEVTKETVEEFASVVPTAVGELILSVMHLGSVVERLAEVTAQDSDPVVMRGLQLAEQCIDVATVLLMEKLPKRT